MARFEFHADGKSELKPPSGPSEKLREYRWLVHQKLSNAQQDDPWTLLACQFSECELLPIDAVLQTLSEPQRPNMSLSTVASKLQFRAFKDCSWM